MTSNKPQSFRPGERVIWIAGFWLVWILQALFAGLCYYVGWYFMSGFVTAWICRSLIVLIRRYRAGARIFPQVTKRSL